MPSQHRIGLVVQSYAQVLINLISFKARRNPPLTRLAPVGIRNMGTRVFAQAQYLMIKKKMSIGWRYIPPQHRALTPSWIISDSLTFHRLSDPIRLDLRVVEPMTNPAPEDVHLHTRAFLSHCSFPSNVAPIGSSTGMNPWMVTIYIIT